MLRAFRKQLKEMGADPTDTFVQHIRNIVGIKDASRFAEPLREMIVRMPEMILQIRQWADETNHPERTRRLHNFALAYLYNPTDFLPEKSEGLFGYLDDAYIVALVYETTLQELQVAQDGLHENVASYNELEEWISLTRQLVPDMTQAIEKILHHLDGNSSSQTYASGGLS